MHFPGAITYWPLQVVLCQAYSPLGVLRHPPAGSLEASGWRDPGLIDPARPRQAPLIASVRRSGPCAAPQRSTRAGLVRRSQGPFHRRILIFGSQNRWVVAPNGSPFLCANTRAGVTANTSHGQSSEPPL